jgi:hypothetical protein
MSHLGILLLREILSARPGTLCDRVFAPWADYEEHLRAAGLPLASLESGRPAGAFDLLGFSLCYELTYTNVLAMLDLSGIPLLSKDRSEEHPLVVAGGVCTLNPAPVAPFFDALLVGDGRRPGVVSCVESWKERNGTGGNSCPTFRIEAFTLAFPRVSRRVLPPLAGSPFCRRRSLRRCASSMTA